MPDPDVMASRGALETSGRGLENSAKRWFEGGSAPTRGCTVRAMRTAQNRVYVACGSGGLWVLQATDAEFDVVERRDLGGNVSGFFDQAGQLWALVQRTEARAVASLTETPEPSLDLLPLPDERFPRLGIEPAPATSVVPSQRYVAPSTPDLSNIEGRVVRVDGREVVIDLGIVDGIRPGTRIELLVSRPPVERMEDTGESRFVELAVGVVRTAGVNHARVALGLNERVPVGAYARPTRSPITASTSGPPRVSGVWEASGFLRLFAALDELGGGVLLDATAGYRFESAIHLEASIQPLGLASAEDGGVSTFTAFALVNYDTRLFEIGTGLGAQTVNDPDVFEAAGSGALVPQHLRLGAQDGLNLDLLSSAVLFRKRFRFSGFRGSLQIPLSDAGWFVSFRGGGGIAGYAFGEFAVRALLSGNGHSSSSFLVASVGGVGIFKSRDCSSDAFFCEGETAYAGPMVGIGLEHRF